MNDTIRDPGSFCVSQFFLWWPLSSGYHSCRCHCCLFILGRSKKERSKGFFFVSSLRRHFHCSQADLPLYLIDQNQPKGVRRFDCFSSILILRPVMVLPLWGQEFFTGWLPEQIEVVWAEKQCVKWSGLIARQACWACCLLGGDDWFGTHCSRMISRQPCVLLAPRMLRFCDIATWAEGIVCVLTLGYVDPAGTQVGTDKSDLSF